MATRQCEKCGETVDAAKAFCPACGNAFVDEEKRDSQSKYDSVELTMQMGQTMYGQMLSDMGLNLDKPSDPAPTPEKRVEVITPIAAAASAQTRSEAPRPVASPSAAAAPVQPKSSNRVLWIVAGVVAGFFAVLILLGLIGGAFYWYMGRGQ